MKIVLIIILLFKRGSALNPYERQNKGTNENMAPFLYEL